jgi:lysine 2,3-aminomutase
MKFHFREIEPWPNAGSDWTNWRWQMKNSLKEQADFSALFNLSEDEVRGFSARSQFQVRSTPYYASLASRTNGADPIRKMILPHALELSVDGQQVSDPLGENAHSPVQRIVHRYPDRVLFLVTDFCSVYCRYCLRKHFTGQEQSFIGQSDYLKAIEYIRSNPGVREVILSGGDPLTLSEDRLERLLTDIRSVDHVEIIRVGSRMPVVCPMRITSDLAKLLRRFAPVYFMTHFNHPAELTKSSAEAIATLVDHGVPVFNQMVLLRGVNNHPAIVQALSRRLLYLRAKPYYVFQCDPSRGTEHFRTSVEESMQIQRELWGRLSGLAMPNLSLDIPGGGGKVGLVPDYETSCDANVRHYRGWDGIEGSYRDPVSKSDAPSDLASYLEEWRELKDQRYGKSLC